MFQFPAPGSIARRLLLPVLLLALGGAGARAAEVAHFVVSDQVAVPDPGPFAANVSVIGNGADLFRTGSGFEPAIYRDWFPVGADAPDSIIAKQALISRWDTMAEGALDGAEVDILRLENGAFRLVRRDRIAEGGFHASGWVSLLPGNRAIPADETRYTFAWDTWNRPDAPYYFTVRSIDSSGTLSEPSAPVMARSPAKIPRQKRAPAQKLIKVEEADEFTTPWSRPAAPRNLQVRELANGRLDFTWEPGGGWIEGYVIERSDSPPEAHRGFVIDLEQKGGPPIREGDMVILRKTVTNPVREAWLTNRVWKSNQARLLEQPLVNFLPGDEPGKTWELKPHEPGSPVTEPGQTYLEMTLADGVRERIGRGNNSGLAQEWYPVLDPAHSYRMEVWLKADRQTKVRFQLVGFHGKDPNKVQPKVLDVGTSWQKYSYTFSPKAFDPGDAPGKMTLVVEGPVTLGIDNFRIFRADAPYLDFLPENYERLAQSGMGTLRTHALIKTRTQTYDLEQLTEPGGVPSGISGQNSLPQLLGIMERGGVDPWIQIEPHFSPEEWLGLIEYLAAPYDPARDSPASKPWAAKRAAQGRPAPWVDAFDRIYFEIGNETWNRNFAPWIFRQMTDAATGEEYSRGEVYGMYQEYVSGILRQSPYWTPELAAKFTTMIGGWEHGPRYGAEAAARTPSADMLTTAPYIGGWEAKAALPGEQPVDFARLLTHVLQIALPKAEEHVEKTGELNRNRVQPLVLGTYEAGPGYLLNGLNNARIGPEDAALQERVMKSKAAGTATLDAFLARALLGYRLQTFFIFGDGPRWNSHALPQNGGQAYPSWIMLSAFNREATGDFLDVDTLVVPRADLPGTRRRAEVDDAPLVSLYATRQGDRLALIVVSRQLPGFPDPDSDGHSRVVIDLPVNSAQRLRRLSLSGRYNDHNVKDEAVRLIEEDLGRPTGLPRLEIDDLPPGEALIYVLEGVN
ncbi:hypothetical protein KHP62_20250 [Rhodobacteraceae bacterium NNCM2]|nr:hypothetical protein [Coraliihabitans acroporae]